LIGGNGNEGRVYSDNRSRARGWLLGDLSEGSRCNGQGETIEETKANLRDAIELIFEDRKADVLRGLPDDAIQDKVMLG